jgi:hypothetical protein
LPPGPSGSPFKVGIVGPVQAPTCLIHSRFPSTPKRATKISVVPNVPAMGSPSEPYVDPATITAPPGSASTAAIPSLQAASPPGNCTAPSCRA